LILYRVKFAGYSIETKSPLRTEKSAS